MNRAITIQPHFTDSAAMLRRIEMPQIRTTKRFETVLVKRDAKCVHCGREYTKTRRKVCRCGEFLDR